MLSIESNSKENSCNMKINGDIGDIMYETIIANKAVLSWMNSVEENAARDLADILIEELQSFLDGSLDMGEEASQESVYISDEALETLQEIINNR